MTSKKSSKSNTQPSVEAPMINDEPKAPTTVIFNIRHGVSSLAIDAVVDVLGVTNKRAREIIQRELTTHGMTEDSCIMVGTTTSSMRYEIVTNGGEMRAFASAYENHRIVNLTTGEALCVRPSPTGRGPGVVSRWSDKIIAETTTDESMGKTDANVTE